MTTLPLLAICLLSRWAALVAALIVLLGLFRLGGNPGLISLAVRSAGRAPILGSALTVAAFNFGTAAGPGSTGSRWTLKLGPVGPATVGAVIAAMTLIPTIIVAVMHDRRTAVAAP